MLERPARTYARGANRAEVEQGSTEPCTGHRRGKCRPIPAHLYYPVWPVPFGATYLARPEPGVIREDFSLHEAGAAERRSAEVE
jgi:hypothetical protein